MGWSAQVAGHLLDSKRRGLPWPEAKRLAAAMYPPRGRDAGDATPRLFAEDGRAPDTVVSFFWRVARNAYDDVTGPPLSGNGPALQHFKPDMLRDLDSSEPARKYRRAA